MDTTRSEQSFEDKRVTKLQLGNEGPLPAPKVLNKSAQGKPSGTSTALGRIS